MDDYKALSRDIDLKDGSPLRRYMDLPKYVDLLRSRTLYLRRADRFVDKFEGALPPHIRAGIDSARSAGNTGESADDFYSRCRKSTFISCWTSGAKDNMALWQLFGGASNSVAISTTIGRVTQMCAHWSERTHIAKVKYIDHFENPDMILGRSFDILQFKHEAFEFEREVRVIVPQPEDWLKNPEYLRRPISNVNDLITSVVVAPEAGSWFLDLVRDLGQRYGLNAPVRMSQLASIPS
jgi:hypothetical protein